jgi:hypothetical protein
LTIRQRNFAVLRNNIPIQHVRIKDSVDPGIQFGLSFAEWEAAVAAGATLDDLFEWDESNKFPVPFKEKVVAWYRLHKLVSMHSQDAVAQKSKRKK